MNIIIILKTALYVFLAVIAIILFGFFVTRNHKAKIMNIKKYIIIIFAIIATIVLINVILWGIDDLVNIH